MYFQNEKFTRFDIILKGTILVQDIDSKGNALTISDFNVGDVLGGNLLFSHKNFYPMTVIAKTDAIILHIKKDLIIKLCQINVVFLNNFLQSISDKTLILTDKVKSLSMKTIRQCIIDFLIYESFSQSSNTIKLQYTKKELAEKFGIQRPSLSRELNKMRKDGLIEYDAHSITIIEV
ncbi:Crp/Fnr family transcriptional regulator [Clostridium sp.]|uniref:Crp/Fnr family transcriptional regulator n=1 Tax=Clostridium sp. TaxID=1506 RepID=UPI003F4B6B3F